MITIYKKNAFPEEKEFIRINDIYFNKYTVEMLDNKAADMHFWMSIHLRIIE